MVANLKFRAVQTCANPVDLEKRFKQWSYSRYHRRRCSRERASETPVPVNQNRSPVAAVKHLPVIPSKQQAEVVRRHGNDFMKIEALLLSLLFQALKIADPPVLIALSQ